MLEVFAESVVVCLFDLPFGFFPRFLEFPLRSPEYVGGVGPARETFGFVGWFWVGSGAR